MIWSDLIFVFAFLPVYLVASFCCREAWAKNAVSVAASLIFITWGRHWYWLLIILPVILIYILGLLSKRVNRLACAIVTGAFASCFAAVAVISLGAEASLGSMLISVGLCLFALRCILYEKNIVEGMEPERDFFAIAAYLISVENMLISPLDDYADTGAKLSERRAGLSGLSSGACMFIRGFAKTAVLGLAFDRVRLAALSGSAFPWLNALILFASASLEAYVVVSGLLSMSCGMKLMNGFYAEPALSVFTPGIRLGTHVSGLWKSLPGFVSKCFCESSAASAAMAIAAASVASGVFFGFGAGAAACFMAIVAGLIIEGASPTGKKAGDIILTFIVWNAAALMLCCRSPEGLVKFFSALNYYKYDYDITYALNAEFWRSLPWLAAGIVSLSPLPSAVAGFIRRAMRESDGAYAASRIAETLFCVFLLIIGALASAVG